MHYKTCEICGIRAGRNDGEKRIFMAKFPLDEERCKQWVKMTGKEDLVHVPIEKLHQLKQICGNHFLPNDLKKKKTQLKKNAIPSVGLTAEPLADELLIGFPLHVAKTETSDPKQTDPSFVTSTEHNYCTPKIDKYKTSEERKEGPFSWQQDSAVVPFEDAETSEERKEGPFSWQQNSAVVPFEDAEPYMLYEPLVPEAIEHAPSPKKQEEKVILTYDQGAYRCNICSLEIAGFRYTCVQCLDFDLCDACEARQMHATHYMLRIPGPRPHGEVSEMLQTIRRALLSDAIVHVVGHDQHEAVEVKEEPEQVDPIHIELADDNTELIKNEFITKIKTRTTGFIGSFVDPITHSEEEDVGSTRKVPIEVKAKVESGACFDSDQPASRTSKHKPKQYPPKTKQPPIIHVPVKLSEEVVMKPGLYKSPTTREVIVKLLPAQNIPLTTQISIPPPLPTNKETQKKDLRSPEQNTDQSINPSIKNITDQSKIYVQRKISPVPRKILKQLQEIKIVKKTGANKRLIDSPTSEDSSKKIKVVQEPSIVDTEASQSLKDIIGASNRSVDSPSQDIRKNILQLKQLESDSARVCLQRLTAADTKTILQTKM